MRYLNKTEDSAIIQEGWQYATAGHRPRIRDELLREQRGFCAYTERFVTPIDACEIEHFDDRLKNTSADSYWNWYAVHRWINLRKRRIEPFLPILKPHDPSVPERIHYKDGQFQAVSEDDTEANNLIDFLLWNDPTLAEYRSRHIARIKQIRRDFFAGRDEEFLTHMTGNPENLNFISVLEVEIGLSFP